MIIVVFLFPLALLALVLGMSILEDRLDAAVRRGETHRPHRSWLRRARAAFAARRRTRSLAQPATVDH